MLAPQRVALLLLLLMVSTLQLPCPPSCPSAISPLCGPGQTSQHILSAAETGRNLSAETHLQEGKRSQLLTSPCLPNVTAADSQAEELQTFHHQNPGERSSNGLFVDTEPAEPTGTVESNSDGARVSTSPQSWSLCRKLLLWVWFWCPVRVLVERPSLPRVMEVFLITRQEFPLPNRIMSQTLAIVCKI